MAFSDGKETLIKDLKKWMDDGAADKHTLISGVLEYVAIMKKFGINGKDTFGNSVSGFTGSGSSAQMLTLTNGNSIQASAKKMAQGTNLDWSFVSLDTTSGPGDMASPISNLTNPADASDLEPIFLNHLLLNYDESILAATSLANAIEKVCLKATFTFNYITVLGSPSVVTGKIT